ncbi:MAG: hypothetical protein GYB37_05505, partial [Algicola sp.]|nr:hypothetical protein [Algicola sp.]
EEAGYSNGQPRNAFTQKTDGKMEWIITLDDDYVNNATQLSIARTIIHESVHAYLGYILKVNRFSSLSIGLQQYYIANNSEDENLTHHEFMEHFVEAMSISLSIWDNKKQAQSYYEKLAWGGLEGTTAYEAQPNKSEIKSAITNENNGSNNALGVKCP